MAGFEVVDPLFLFTVLTLLSFLDFDKSWDALSREDTALVACIYALDFTSCPCTGIKGQRYESVQPPNRHKPRGNRLIPHELFSSGWVYPELVNASGDARCEISSSSVGSILHSSSTRLLPCFSSLQRQTSRQHGGLKVRNVQSSFLCSRRELFCPLSILLTGTTLDTPHTILDDPLDVAVPLPHRIDTPRHPLTPPSSLHSPHPDRASPPPRLSTLTLARTPVHA